MNGGFIYVDFGGYDVSDIDATGVTISGIYAKCQAAVTYGKAIILYDIKINGADVSPFYTIVANGTVLSISIGSVNLKITSADKVKLIEDDNEE